MYRRELVPMIALGLSLTGSREAALDLAHESMLRAYRNWSSVGAMERPGAWVRRVLINLAIDQRRQSSRHPTLTLVGASESIPTNSGTDQPSSSSFWSLVRKLPRRQRAAIALHYLEDMSVLDIADVMHVSEGTVKKSLFEARRSLATTLGAERASDEVD